MILLTGATGYVGGRLLNILEKRGERVRCMVRRPDVMRGRVGPETEVVGGDVLDRASLEGSFDGIETAYYLIHSMGSSGGFVERDRQAAENFAEFAERAGLRRIIYLGGLGDPGEGLSPHLASRQEVGDVLRSYATPVTEFRASVVIGSGSLSFELIRALTERLPVMVTPRWIRARAQPIAIRDVLAYLVAGTKETHAEDRIYEIGGRDAVSYADLIREYARQRGLRRLLVPVPLLTPWLSSLWLGLVTPIYARIGARLIDSIRHATVVRDRGASEAFPDIRPLGMADAIREALANEEKEFAETRWCDALSSGGTERQWGGVRFGQRLVDSRSVQVRATPEQAFRPIRTIGGKRGWYYADQLWRLRGMLDLLVGGVGHRRGRPHPERLRVGDTIDWWRVEAWEPDRHLRLKAEMRLPGRAWLEFDVRPVDTDGTEIRQTAIFDPVGLSGLAYWYLLYPFHDAIFTGMLRGIARKAEQAPTRNAPIRRRRPEAVG